jgi:putative ABC transport system ATP-binding protein
MPSDVVHDDAVLHLQDVRFGYVPKSPILSIDTFHVARGESVFLRGPSGSGKSTLLSLIGGVISPWSGKIRVCGQDIVSLSPTGRDSLRAEKLGIIFQQLNLLPYLDVIGNVTLACRFSRTRARNAETSDGSTESSAQRLLAELGLPEALLKRSVSDLSVGQQQRVAVARSLIGGPDLIIADEPTSALDTANRDRFIELLDAQRAQTGCSLLFVSHDETLARHFDRAVDLAAINAGVDA